MILIPWFKNRIIRRGGEGREGGGAGGSPSPAPGDPVPAVEGEVGAGRWHLGDQSSGSSCAPQGFGHPEFCGKGRGVSRSCHRSFSSRKPARLAVTAVGAVPSDCVQAHSHSHLHPHPHPKSIPILIPIPIPSPSLSQIHPYPKSIPIPIPIPNPYPSSSPSPSPSSSLSPSPFHPHPKSIPIPIISLSDRFPRRFSSWIDRSIH